MHHLKNQTASLQKSYITQLALCRWPLLIAQKYLGDSDFVKVPLQGLSSKRYARSLFNSIPRNQARRSNAVGAGKMHLYESNDTTHFTVVDKKGNVVTSTQTINGLLGSGVVIPKTGIVLNNEMDDFSAKPGVANMFGAIGGKQNAIAPKKRPLSSMSPTIVFRNKKPLLALGSPSGTRIITCVLNTILNYTTYGLPLYESVAALRYHHQWLPDEIRVDAPFFSSTTQKKLEQLGYTITNNPLGCKVQAVAIEGDTLHGVSDPRGEGLSIGF